MAITPITGTPISRAVTGEREQSPANEAPPQKTEPASSQDQVTLSDEALRRLQEDSKIESSDDARRTAGNVKAELSKNPDITLGLDEKTSF